MSSCMAFFLPLPLKPTQDFTLQSRNTSEHLVLFKHKIVIVNIIIIHLIVRLLSSVLLKEEYIERVIYIAMKKQL